MNCSLPLAALLLAAALGPSLISSAADSSAADEDAGGQKPCELDRSMKVNMKYLLYLPPEYDQQESWPLLLFLHGAGERGDNLELVKKHGPPKLVEAGQHFPFVIVSPQCPNDRRWEPLELAVLLDEIRENYKIDEDRIYVTGLSMGGFGTFALAAYQPGRLAAIAPICGGGEPIVAKLVRPVPAWVFHGAKDSVVPLKRSEEMVEAMKQAGGEARLTVYPEAGHDSWTETYANPELYQWLLQYKRAAR